MKINEYEINENVAIIKLKKKDGSIINGKIDAEDLQRVLDKGAWFAEWHKDFNNYLVQNMNFTSIAGKKHSEKQALHSFILDAHPKAPIRHINGDTLDNRKVNLEIFDQNKINDYEPATLQTVAIILRDKYGRENGRTLIDKEDLDRTVNHGYTWVLYKVNNEPFAVANTPEGRIYLNRFIMNTPEDMITHHINLNTLDNTKSNVENTNPNLDTTKPNLDTTKSSEN